MRWDNDGRYVEYVEDITGYCEITEYRGDGLWPCARVGAWSQQPTIADNWRPRRDAPVGVWRLPAVCPIRQVCAWWNQLLVYLTLSLPTFCSLHIRLIYYKQTGPWLHTPFGYTQPLVTYILWLFHSPWLHTSPGHSLAPGISAFQNESPENSWNLLMISWSCLYLPFIMSIFNVDYIRVKVYQVCL